MTCYSGARRRRQDPKTYSLETLERMVMEVDRELPLLQDHVEKLTTYMFKLEPLDAELVEAKAALDVLQRSQPSVMSWLLRSGEARAYDARLKELRLRISGLEFSIRYWANEASKPYPKMLGGWTPEGQRYLYREENFSDRYRATTASDVRYVLQGATSEVEKKRNWRAYLIGLIEEKRRIRAVQSAKEAKVAAFDGKLREQAWLIKQQLDTYPNCPYCGGSLGANPHADHIYPVAYGGLSTKENMVIICAECNKKKGAMTLRESIETYHLDRARIEDTLKRLGKKF